MKSNEIRNRFIQYFQKHNHSHIQSSSLIPENDPTLLFANAGMNQFKNLFLGLEHKDYKRAVSVQKCVRAGGKHNDLENVGFTARHHTFFEMLGNFSFGDYFKKEAIHFAWDFLTRELQIPKEKLYVTVFETDDEAADIWHKQEGVPKERIFRFGEKDNFWRMGEVGPCGPCTEIFYDHGPHAGKESDPYKGIASGEDRYVEIWNLVFMQYFEKSPGQLEPLPKPSVDTGSGLERVTAALQGKLNNYDTDLFWPLIEKAAKICRKEFLLDSIHELNRDGINSKIKKEIKDQIAALRVVADHTRSCSFLIADGALPSNEGRGYVLRRILRRAVRFANQLSNGNSFIPEICEQLISTMGQSYPELVQRKNHILNTIKEEQDRFMTTLSIGENLLSEELTKLKKQKEKTVSGEFVFKMYDTYGFPSDLTKLIAEENGFAIDEKQFEHQMDLAKEKAKSSWKGKALDSDESHLVQLAQSLKDKYSTTEFKGYSELKLRSKVLGLTNGKSEQVKLNPGQSGYVVLDKTVFYPEGGGQAGDVGIFKSLSAPTVTSKNISSELDIQVLNTIKINEIVFHQVEVVRGEIILNQELEIEVESHRRRQTASNHSATHLLHSALRHTLGTHVTQAGSLVDSIKLRFDFTHNKPLSSDEISKIERIVNDQIAKSNSVHAEILPYKLAIEKGAMALFGEKYGDAVRVLSMGDFSAELCGGTHVSNTSQIRVFKIVSESGVSSGVRRIEALTSDMAIQYLLKNLSENQRARESAGLVENWQTFLESDNSILKWMDDKKAEIKNLEKEIKKIQSSKVDIDSIIAQSQLFESNGKSAKLVFADLDINDRDLLAQMADQLKNKTQTGVIVVIGKGDDSHPIIVSVTKDLNPAVSAGQLLKDIALIMGGKGGGRPDFAQGSVPDRSKILDAKEKAKSILLKN